MSVPPVIVVALCGSTRKHEQSFDALKLAAKVLAASHPLPPIFCNNQLIGATNTTTTNNIHNNNSRGVSPTASPPRSPREATAQDILANVRFHFVHLSWSAKGGGDDDTDDGDDDQRLQLFAPPNVDGVAEDRREELLLDQEFSGATYVSSNSLSHHVSGGTEVDAADVDVLLHKTTTFGSLRATRAVARWVAAVQEERAAMHRPPLVVVDPLEKVEQLAERQRLYAMLDAPSRISEAASVAVVPRTFSWCRSGDSYGDHTAHEDDDDDDDDVNGHHHHDQHAESSSPLLPSMSSTMKLVTTSGEEERCAAHVTNNNAATTSSSSSAPAPDAAESFWIIKPDESSGPRFTHHLVAWLATGGRGAAPLHVPPHVIASLPAEAERFIVQEFYAAALPVILKVYCVGGHTVVKPKLTLPLLARLAEHAERSEPFFFDSQDKNIFSSAPPPPPPPRPSSSSRVDDVDDDGSNKKRCGTHVDVMKCWLNFLADGSPAHQTMMACADELSSAVELTLYGFDVLLLPRHLARAHQRRRFPRGMGYDGAAMAMAEAVELTTWSSEGFSSAAGGWSAIFDETGNPTALLQGCVPVVVDVNYFPGYQGMPEASQHLLKYMVSKCSEAAMACE